jgi:hypothetical protein
MRWISLSELMTELLGRRPASNNRRRRLAPTGIPARPWPRSPRRTRAKWSALATQVVYTAVLVPPGVAAASGLCQQHDGGIGNDGAPGRRADLARPRPAIRRARRPGAASPAKTLPAHAICPAGAKDQVGNPGSDDRLFAGQLALTILMGPDDRPRHRRPVSCRRTHNQSGHLLNRHFYAKLRIHSILLCSASRRHSDGLQRCERAARKAKTRIL